MNQTAYGQFKDDGLSTSSWRGKYEVLVCIVHAVETLGLNCVEEWEAEEATEAIRKLVYGDKLYALHNWGTSVPHGWVRGFSKSLHRCSRERAT